MVRCDTHVFLPCAEVQRLWRGFAQRVYTRGLRALANGDHSVDNMSWPPQQGPALMMGIAEEDTSPSKYDLLVESCASKRKVFAIVEGAGMPGHSIPILVDSGATENISGTKAGMVPGTQKAYSTNISLGKKQGKLAITQSSLFA